MAKIVQTAGRDQLGDLAPEFAHFNDDILFGENWNNEDISLKTRCIITVVTLMSSGITDSSLIYHLENAKNNGVTRKEMAAIVTHTAFYVGWPKAWAVFRMMGDVWKDEDEASQTGTITKEEFQETIDYPIGDPNPFGDYFDGQSFLYPLADEGFSIFNVTFEPGCRNFWHIHHADEGGGQMLIAVGGEGWYQEWGKEPVKMTPGTIITIPEGVKHWHGAAKDSWFSHLAFDIPGTNASNEWLEPVSEEDYNNL